MQVVLFKLLIQKTKKIVLNFLNELNQPQKDAVTSFKGASLVIAGAGSGKTRVLTYRIAYLLHQGIYARNILSLTFTNKAAKEMKERISEMLGPDIVKNLWMGTFHSVFSRILRSEADKLGFTSSFTIYDTIDSKNLIKKIIKELNLDDKTYKPNEIYRRISSAKNNLITAKLYINDHHIIKQDQQNNKPRIAEIYKMYSNRCKNSDAMDFDDLLLYTNMLFRDFPDVLKKYQDIFKFILVDEYQDTNFSQYLIVNKLSQKHGNICVVGDDAQSIYAFRGAKIENILNFKRDYPNYNLFKLEQNYRSTKTIVDAANSLIKKNKNQIKKNVFSANNKGEKIKVLECLTDKDEAYKIAKLILDTQQTNNCNNSDFAILYRTNAQSRNFEESLLRFNIPHKVYGGIAFYQRKEIKDVLSYFRLIINKKDNEALLRIINYPARGIGKTTISRIEDFSIDNSINFWDTITNIEKYNIGLNSGTITKLKEFQSLIIELSNFILEKDAFDLASTIVSKTGILKDLNKPESHEIYTKYENVEELLNGIKEFTDSQEDTAKPPTLDYYMENIALQTNVDNESEDDKNKVTIMTIHSAKGLEFKYVFLVGLEEDLFPSKMSASTQKDLEEERRLFYVALTRAKNNAVISYANERYKWGVPTYCRPSRFIKEIDEQYLELPETTELEKNSTKSNVKNYSSKKTYGNKAQKANTINPISLNSRNLIKISQTNNINKQNSPVKDIKPDDPSKIKTGMTVKHSRFGIGKVLEITGILPNIKATVDFQNAGEKKLLLKFAKLQIQN